MDSEKRIYTAEDIDKAAGVWSDNQIFYIEVKNERGKPRQDQIQFHQILTQRNVIHGIARSAEDAVKIVSNGLVGYGFKDYGGELE